MKDLLKQIKGNSTKLPILLIICMISMSSFITFIRFNNNFPISYVTHNNLLKNSINTENEYETKEYIYNDSKISFSYVPVDNINGTGDNFDVGDNLQVNHPVSLELDSSNGRSDAFTISTISDYTADSLQYNMQITSKSDFITQQTAHNKDEILGSSTIRIAQGFNVPWAYGVFSGANIYLIIETAIGGDEIELYVVSENITDGLPDLTDVRSTEIDGPYNSSNPIIESTPSNTQYYNFTESTLSSGNYYVIVEITTYDASNNQGFNWRGQQVSVYADSYTHDGTYWSLENKDVILAPELMPSYANGTALIFEDPTLISLQDNGQPITSLTQAISSTGTHTLTADTTVQIAMNNSYSFSRQFLASSSYQITNSSFSDYSASWKIDWATSSVNTASYDNPYRYLFLNTPNDWNDSEFSFTINDSISLSGVRTSSGYLCYMNSIFSIDTYSSGSISLSTTSPNNLYDFHLMDGSVETSTFSLGFWTTDTLHAFGYEGSSVIVDAYIKDKYFNDISSGDLNFTIFNPNGEIIPIKSSLFSNLTYVDNSSYSLLVATQVLAGLYQFNTSFDPSVYGSDEAGNWTVMLHWINGTEVGFTTKTISVTIATAAEFEWEITPDSDNWTSDNATQITRINGESINIRANYFTRSEPYFSGLGVPITTANISYNTNWLETGFLSYVISYYAATIPIDAEADVYHVDMEASGDLLTSYEIQFSVLVLHQFGLELDQTEYYLNYSNAIDIDFSVLDYSNGSSLVIPDDVNLKVDSVDLTSSDYSYVIRNGILELNLNTLDIDLVPGTYVLEISVSKENFIESYSQVNATETVVLHIQSIITEIELITSSTTIYHNNQTTITFRYIDTNHSSPITGASFSLDSDISEMEIITTDEEDGLYTVIIKISEPTASVMNVFLTISKSGYEAKANFLLATINISSVEEPIIPEPNGTFLTTLIIALSVTFVVLSAGVVYFFLRTRRKLSIFTRKQVTSKARDIFQSAMMLKKVLVIHQETSLPVFDLNLVDNVNFDPSMVSGILQAISSIGIEMVGSATGMKKIEYYGFMVTSGYSGAYTVYAFSETELCIELVQGISNIARWFDVIFGFEGTQWDGSMEIFQEYKEQIKERIVDDLYIWVLYPLEVPSEVSESEIHLTSLEKKIIETIKEKEKINMVLLLNEIKEYKKEEIISAVIKLVKEEKLIRNINE